MKKPVTTEKAPLPQASFSQGLIKGGLFQVSGQGPVDPHTNQYLFPGDVKAQTRQTLENIRAILEAGGAGVGDVMMFRVYLTEQSLFADFNEAYGEFLAEYGTGAHPCRTTVFVGLPHPQMLVEIDALAVVKDN